MGSGHARLVKLIDKHLTRDMSVEYLKQLINEESKRGTNNVQLSKLMRSLPGKYECTGSQKIKVYVECHGYMVRFVKKWKKR